jgi:hypothetical protein
VADESARFNVGSVQRDVNYPTMALMYLKQEHQHRSSFVREGSARVDGVATWVFAGDIRPVEMIRGEARYSNVRRFRATSTIKDATIVIP